MTDPDFDFSVLGSVASVAGGSPQLVQAGSPRAPQARRFGGRQEGSGPKKLPTLDEAFPGLPDSKNSAADALWAYNNSERICQKRKNGRHIVWWRRASEAPPSRGVEFWIKLRQETSFKDFTDRLAKAMSGHDDQQDEGDVQRYEVKRISEVRKILEEMLA